MTLQEIKDKVYASIPPDCGADDWVDGITGEWMSNAETRKELTAVCETWGSLDDCDQDIIAAYIESLREELKGWVAYKNGIDAALNSGDGSYRP